MKKIALFIFAIIISISLYAQNPLATFFSEDGYKFRVIMDGKEINSEPKSRVEYIEMDNDWAFVKIIFENRELPPVEKKISGVDADGKASSITWVIKKNNKGKWQIKASSWKTLEEAVKDKATSDEHSEHTTQPTTSTTTTETTTLTTSHPDQSEVSVSTDETNMTMDINMNDGQENTNVNVNISVPGTVVTQTESHTTYTTVTTTTENTTAYSQSGIPESTTGYSGRTGCDYPMGEDMFTDAKRSIESKDFEDTKLTVAKQVTNSNCLLSSQVKQVMQLFEFEDTRLEFAKAAFSNVYDIDNYYQVNDAFEYESSIEELNEYISN